MNDELLSQFSALSASEKEAFLRSVSQSEVHNKSNVLLRKLNSALESGESKTVEFKSSLSWDLKKNTKEKYIETSAVKTVCGFLNSSGGMLILGANDSGQIIGIDTELDKLHKSKDKFLLYFRNLLKTRLGEKHFGLIDQDLIYFDGKHVMIVDCKVSKFPVYVDESDYYIRTNPSTEKLEGPHLVDYIRQREEKFRELFNEASGVMAEQRETIDAQTQKITSLEREQKRLKAEIDKAKYSGSGVKVEDAKVLVSVETDVMHRGSLNTVLKFSDGTIKTMKTATFDRDLSVTNKAKTLIGKKVKTTCWDPVNQPGKWSNQGYFRNVYEAD